MASFKKVLAQRYLANGKNLISLDNHYTVMKRLLRGRQVRNVIDGGASDGRITRKLLQAFPEATAYLFEPHPDYTHQLQKYADREKRVKPQLMALSDQTGEANLILSSNIGRTSLFESNERASHLAPETPGATRNVAVRTVTIDEWVESNSIPSIDLIKLDIQSGELRALQGAKRTLESGVNLVYTEVFFNPMYQSGALYGDIDAFLRSHNFMLYDLYKPKYGADQLLSFANAIFISKAIAEDLRSDK